MKPRLRAKGGEWVCYDQKFAGVHPSMFKAYQWWWNCHLNNIQWQEIA